MLEAAVRVPDHGKRVPWRFLRIAGDARDALGEALVARALQRDPEASEATLDKDRKRFQSPLVLAVVARLGICTTHQRPQRRTVGDYAGPRRLAGTLRKLQGQFG